MPTRIQEGKRLSKAQQQVIDLMRLGWTLRQSVDFTGGTWLQRTMKNKVEVKRVSGATLHVLFRFGLIEGERKFPITKWELTEVRPK